MVNVDRLQMIQGVINRIAGNSFSLKGWSVTVAAALLGFSAADSDRVFGLLAIYVILAFAGLDAYYSAMEKAYRDLYRMAVTAPPENWDLDAERINLRTFVAALRRPAVWVLHGTVLVVGIAVTAWR